MSGVAGFVESFSGDRLYVFKTAEGETLIDWGGGTARLDQRRAALSLSDPPLSSGVCEVGDPHRFDREPQFRPLVRHRRRRALIGRRHRQPNRALRVEAGAGVFVGVRH